MFEFTELDLRQPNPARKAEGERTDRLIFEMGQVMPESAEYKALMHELLPDLGEGTRVRPPFYCNLASNIHIGKHCSIMPFCKCMSAGQIMIEDDVRIALNCALITNNHDFYECDILTVADIRIKKGAWIGANATILPGVTVGKYAVVGANSLVNRDVPDYAVVVGSPARVIRMLDADKFKD